MRSTRATSTLPAIQSAQQSLGFNDVRASKQRLSAHLTCTFVIEFRFMRLHCGMIFLAAATALMAADAKIVFDKSGFTKEFVAGAGTGGPVPTLSPGRIGKPADTLTFDLGELLKEFPSARLTYQFSSKLGSGCALPTSLPQDSACPQTAIGRLYKPDDRIPIPATVDGKPNGAPTAALYFNILIKNDSDDSQRIDLQAQLQYYQGLQHPLTWDQKRIIQDQISDNQDQISALQEEIKAFAGTSLAEAVQAIEARQLQIRDLRRQIKDLQTQLDHSGLKAHIDQLQQQIKALTDMLDSPEKLLRAGVVPVGEHRKAVYYTLESSGDASNPYLLKHFKSFPIFTTDDVPYVIVLGQRDGDSPQGLRASFTSAAGSYIDVAPVRPLVTQPSGPSTGVGAGLPKFSKVQKVAPTVQADTFVDRVLTFTDRLAGETTYSVTVTGYGVATTTDTITVVTGDNASNQHQVATTTADVKILDSEAWPQVHSLYRYNLSAGVLWSTIRTPTFSRVATGNYSPSGCTPGSSSSSCSPTYQTITDSGGPRILPMLMFTVYPFKRDTQIPVQWKEMIPAPSVGLSLSSPTDDFLIGASSEFKPLRNIQLVYGLHLGRVNKLGATSYQLPTDNSPPMTTTSLRAGGFVGLTFNIDFVKALFGK